jgi:nucleotide sugar dehydrogenase
MTTRLHSQLKNRTATVAVIGLGYVGLPLSLAFTAAGFEVRGFDIDADRVSRLRAGDSYVDDVSDEALADGLNHGFTPAGSATSVTNCDVYIIAVPTGISDGEPAMDAVQAASRTVSEQAGEQETLVVVSSTVYPGATSDVVQPLVERNRPDDSTLFAMVPERLNPGGSYPVGEIPLVVGANTKRARQAATSLFNSVTTTVPVTSTETAELSKTLENTYRMVNIALVNQLVALAERLDADVWEAIDAAGTKPFGFQAFEPGPGVGGHCIPIDPQFLTWRAGELGTELPFIEHAHEVNDEMPQRVIDGVTTAITARGININRASILALGAAYKPNVGDPRHAPAIEIIEVLQQQMDVSVVDPHVDPAEAGLSITQHVTNEMIESADAVVLLVDHDAFDLSRIGDCATLVYDTKNAMPASTDATVVTLGEAASSVSPDMISR